MDIRVEEISRIIRKQIEVVDNRWMAIFILVIVIVYQRIGWTGNIAVNTQMLAKCFDKGGFTGTHVANNGHFFPAFQPIHDV